MRKSGIRVVVRPSLPNPYTTAVSITAKTGHCPLSLSKSGPCDNDNSDELSEIDNVCDGNDDDDNDDGDNYDDDKIEVLTRRENGRCLLLCS